MSWTDQQWGDLLMNHMQQGKDGNSTGGQAGSNIGNQIYCPSIGALDEMCDGPNVYGNWGGNLNDTVDSMTSWNWIWEVQGNSSTQARAWVGEMEGFILLDSPTGEWRRVYIRSQPLGYVNSGVFAQWNVKADQRQTDHPWYATVRPTSSTPLEMWTQPFFPFIDASLMQRMYGWHSRWRGFVYGSDAASARYMGCAGFDPYKANSGLPDSMRPPQGYPSRAMDGGHGRYVLLTTQPQWITVTTVGPTGVTPGGRPPWVAGYGQGPAWPWAVVGTNKLLSESQLRANLPPRPYELGGPYLYDHYQPGTAPAPAPAPTPTPAPSPTPAPNPTPAPPPAEPPGPIPAEVIDADNWFSLSTGSGVPGGSLFAPGPYRFDSEEIARLYGPLLTNHALGNIRIGKNPGSSAESSCSLFFRAIASQPLMSLKSFFTAESPGYSAGTGGTIRMRVWPVAANGSTPDFSGSPLGEATYVPGLSAGEWVAKDEHPEQNFSNPVSLVAGQIYCIHQENIDADTEANNISHDAFVHEAASSHSEDWLAHTEWGLAVMFRSSSATPWSDASVTVEERTLSAYNGMHYIPCMQLTYANGVKQGVASIISANIDNTASGGIDRITEVTAANPVRARLSFTETKHFLGAQIYTSYRTGPGTFDWSFKQGATVLASGSATAAASATDTFFSLVTYLHARIELDFGSAVELTGGLDYDLEINPTGGTVLLIAPNHDGDSVGYTAQHARSDHLAQRFDGSNWVNDTSNEVAYGTNDLGAYPVLFVEAVAVDEDAWAPLSEPNVQYISTETQLVVAIGETLNVVFDCTTGGGYPAPDRDLTSVVVSPVGLASVTASSKTDGGGRLSVAITGGTYGAGSLAITIDGYTQEFGMSVVTPDQVPENLSARASAWHKITR